MRNVCLERYYSSTLGKHTHAHHVYKPDTYTHAYKNTCIQRLTKHTNTAIRKKLGKKIKYKKRDLWVVLRPNSEAVSFFQTFKIVQMSPG